MTGPTPTGSACGCGDGCGCGGLQRRTPAVVGNRPGQSVVGYRAGRYEDFRASMVAGLTRASRPALAGLRTRDTDDPAIALIDAWAVVCDVLTFYTERLAQESYLRTAVERTSLQELGRLVSYRLDPGVAAETVLAFSLERPPVVPSLDPPDPGVVPPAVPTAVELASGLRVQSVPGPGELPQTFETVEDLAARPEWNALPVARSRPHLPTRNRRDVWLAGTGLQLAPGDALLLAGRPPDLVHDRWDLRLVTEVEEDPVAGRTHVRWDRGLGSTNPFNDPAVFTDPAHPAQVLVLRRRVSVFGHQAPVWKAMNDGFRLGYRSQFTLTPADGPEWPPAFDALTSTTDGAVVDLEGSHPDVTVGSLVVVSQESGGFYRELYRVTGTAELSRSAYAVSGRVTRLTLEGEWHDFGSPREVTVMVAPEALSVVEAPDDSEVTGAVLVVDGDVADLPDGRRLVVTGTSPGGRPQSEVVTLASATPAPGGRTTLTLTRALAADLARGGAVVLGNVACATHGETVTQVLGQGDAARSFQAFALQQGPLTHVQADDARGRASTLAVEVDGVRWQEVASTVGSGPTDRVFVTREEPDGSLAVVLGDGLRGARPPTRSHNLRARYRKGLGAAGNVRADTLTQALDRPLGLKGVTNPAPAAGGVDPEDEAHARRSIPLPVRTLGRAVSLTDYADFALAFTGIGKASAAVLPLRGGRTLVVSVASGAGEPPAEPTLRRLEDALRRHGDPHVRVAVRACRAGSFRVAMKVAVDHDRDRDTVLAAVEAALRSAYGREAREIGAPVHRSAVVACAAAVVGVVAVDLDQLHRPGPPSLQQRLVASPAAVVDGAAVAAELLALATLSPLALTEMP